MRAPHCWSPIHDPLLTYPLTTGILPISITETLLCRFNEHEYPLTVSPAPTVFVLQGVLEYLFDKVRAQAGTRRRVRRRGG